MTKVLADANHLYQTAGSGSPAAHAALPKELVPALLPTVTSWILQQKTAPAR